jgi:hypothetical protein
MTLPLIDKQDTFEIVRDELAAILATEIASQQALATTAGKDPNLWKLRVFLEASNPLEQFQENSPADRSPLVNIWYDSSGFDASASNVSERQTVDAVFNIDCYGFGVSSDDGGTGHNPGDREATFAAHRALRLVRNVFMSAEYTYLGMRGTVFGRWPQSISAFQPQQDAQAVQHVTGARLTLRVRFNEFSPQVTGEALERVFATVRRTEDGEIVIEADYNYT